MVFAFPQEVRNEQTRSGPGIGGVGTNGIRPAAGEFRGGPVQTNSGPKKSKFDRLGAGADSSATVTGERGPCVARTARRCETLGLLRCLAVRFSCSISESLERAGDRLGPQLEKWARWRAAAGSARMSAYHSCQHSPSLPSEISM